MKNKTCCFSGHRNMSAKEKSKVYLKLNRQIEKLISEGYDTFLCGRALSFDKNP